LSGIFSPQRIGALMLVAALAAVATGAWMWGSTPDYRVLYANVSDRDGGAIVAALQQMNVQYRFAEGGGAIMVPATKVHEARLKLAGQGLPKTAAPGFELMENARLGTSQFLEQVNYQRGLEGELARSIQALAAVSGARVHLALAKPSVFVREQQKPRASVLLNMHPGRSLNAMQVEAIVHLVSSSVPDMPVANVTVVDQNGSLLSGKGDQAAGALDSTQLKYVQELEQNHARRIEAILLPITGPANVRAQVTADVDFSLVEHAEERFKPNQGANAEAVVRSQQITESQNTGNLQNGGVPGALTNQPPAAAAAPVAAPAQPQPATAPPPASAQKHSALNYEVDRTIRHVRSPVGSIRRISVAVVVNHRQVTDADGKTVSTPRSDEEMQQINRLVREAIGYSEQRGDTISVTSSAFAVPEKEVVPELPWWKQQGSIAIAQDALKHLLIAALALYLLLGILRPFVRSLAARLQDTGPGALLTEDEAPLADGPPALSYQENIEAARSLAKQEPRLVANVVKNWVTGNG